MDTHLEKLAKKLNESDLENVCKVISIVDNVAENYFRKQEHDENYFFFEKKDGSLGNPFFNVYLIGGYLNKKGERPDIDLLIATNVRWSQGFLEPNDWPERVDKWDPIYSNLYQQFESVKKLGELPTEYNIGATKGKVLIQVHSGKGKRLDINYVRSFPEQGLAFSDEKEFDELDLDTRGRKLPKLILYNNFREINYLPSLGLKIIN